MENHGKSVPVVRVGTGSLDEEPKKMKAVESFESTSLLCLQQFWLFASVISCADTDCSIPSVINYPDSVTDKSGIR